MSCRPRRPSPNKRVQRTRLRSPLTRHPLDGGSRQVAAASAGSLLFVLSVTSCVVIDGTRYSQWTGSIVKQSCQAIDAPADNESLLWVSVFDVNGSPLPGATVRMSRLATSSETALERQSSSKGLVAESLDSGEWAVGVRLPGFKSVDARVTLEHGESCTLRCFLVLGDGLNVVH